MPERAHDSLIYLDTFKGSGNHFAFIVSAVTVVQIYADGRGDKGMFTCILLLESVMIGITPEIMVDYPVHDVLMRYPEETEAGRRST